jgi:hypothetical protein
MFLLAAFTLAGTAQTAWFASSLSEPFVIPLDGGRRFRGRRIFGAHKCIRGFVVMVPAAGLAFGLLAALAGSVVRLALWPLSPVEYALLGAWSGFGFMAGELPNSFLKRQLDIEPGEAPAGLRGVLHFLMDRIDSGLGMLATLALAVDVPWLTWIYVLLLGPFIHWSFSFVMFRLGLKGRAA